MAKPKGTTKKRPAPLSLRLTEGERTQLERRSGDLPLSTYVKYVLFAEDAPAYRKGPTRFSADRALVARVLACLGLSGIASNLARLAKAADTGNLMFDEQTHTQLLQACDDVAAMRTLLLNALGKEVPPALNARAGLSPAFQAAASQKD